MLHDEIDTPFLAHASGIIGDTTNGLTGSQIVERCVAHAVDWGVNLPHAEYPFGASSKRQALLANLRSLEPRQQYILLDDLTRHESISMRSEVRLLRIKLTTRYGHLAPEPTEVVPQALIESTRHWLDAYDDVLELYNEALEKREHGAFQRNLLDDLRLALETLLRRILGNRKTLENQIAELGTFIKKRGGSSQLHNMFMKLLEYYANYQNTYVKHSDAVIEEEVDFVVEITSSFMKHVVRLSARDN